MQIYSLYRIRSTHSMKQPVRQTSYFLILGLADPLSISIPVPAVRLALSPQSIAVTGCKRADCLPDSVYWQWVPDYEIAWPVHPIRYQAGSFLIVSPSAFLKIYRIRYRWACQPFHRSGLVESPIHRECYPRVRWATPVATLVPR